MDKTDYVNEFSRMVVNALKRHTSNIAWSALGFEIKRLNFRITVTGVTTVNDVEITSKYETHWMKLIDNRDKVLHDFCYIVNQAATNHASTIFDVAYDEYALYADNLARYFENNWRSD